MKITNNLGLPEPIVDAVENDPYNAGDCDISVTRLISPPRIVELERVHGDELTEDASDRIYSLMGQAIHTILERAGSSGIREQRLFATIDGWIVSGQYDRLILLEGSAFAGTLQDYKTASVWEVMFGIKPERVAQLNCLAYLARQNGYEIKRLQAIMLLRDWQKSRAKTTRDYPPCQVHVFDIPVWDEDECLAYMKERVNAHKSARFELPDCTAEDRWDQPTKYAVVKHGRKSALRVLDHFADAALWTVENGHADMAGVFSAGISIEIRHGASRRCEDYCSLGRGGFCDQWTALQAERAAAPEETIPTPPAPINVADEEVAI